MKSQRLITRRLKKTIQTEKGEQIIFRPVYIKINNEIPPSHKNFKSY